EYFGALGDGFPCGFTEVPVQIITIWKDGKDNYLKRYISANEFSVRTLSDDEDLLNFVRVNINEIEAENVKPYELQNGSIMQVNHSCHYRFTINMNSKIIEKVYDNFDLETDQENPNINFISNNALKLVHL